MPHRFIQARPGFEANGVEVQLQVDVRMRQKAETQTTKINSAKSFVEVHPRKFIPSKYTRYTVAHAQGLKQHTSFLCVWGGTEL